MNYLYLDTNALIKLYRSEKGSNWLHNFIIGKRIVVSELILFESATVIGKYYRSGEYLWQAANDLYSQLKQNCRNYDVVSLQISLLEAEVRGIAFPLTLVKGASFVRALDAIHVASAQFARKDIIRRDPGASFVVVSSDGQLLKVAQANGLLVENPEDYQIAP